MSKTYKVYLLEQSNHVVAVHFVIAADDAGAVEFARRLPGLENREVWDGERRIAIVELGPSDAPHASLWL